MDLARAACAGDRDAFGDLFRLLYGRVHRTIWGMLGRAGKTERSYGVDPLGREVYEACDGKTTVKGIVSGFQRRHKLSRSEAEVAVTTFLKTLVSKGLIAVAVDKDRIVRKT